MATAPSPRPGRAQGPRAWPCPLLDQGMATAPFSSTRAPAHWSWAWPGPPGRLCTIVLGRP
eukprot:2495433-Pyramimonas_sp.AAC.1